MATIVPIVEGHGEVQAVRTLIVRTAQAVSPDIHVNVAQPIRVKRHLVVKPEELEKRIRLAASKGGHDGRILVLLDADQDCPAELGPQLLSRAQQERNDRKIAVVLAKTEYEAWFVAAAPSLIGATGLAASIVAPADPESLGSPKEWIRARMQGGRYRETTHQATLTSRFDLAMARRAAPSFDKMCRSIAALLDDGGP